MLDKIARARAKARAHARALIAGTTAGFPWLVIAGKTLTGWVVIDMDATLVTSYSAKEGAAPTWTVKATVSTHWERGAGIPASAWPCSCGPGNAGSNTFTDRRCWPPPSGRSRPGSGAGS